MVPWRIWLEFESIKREVVSSSLTMGKNFFIVKLDSRKIITQPGKN